MGALGFFTGVLTENMSMAYLIAFAYYSFEFATKGRYTKVFYLFSLRKGYFSDFKLIILIFAIFLVITSIFILHKRQSFLR
jgi:hypothetical protein